MKVICVPKDKSALRRLDYDLSKSNDLIEVYLDSNTFAKLLEVKFFQKINDAANSNIDDFEDESIIEANELRKVLDSGVFELTGYDNNLKEVILKIENLFLQALNLETGVFFFF